MSFEWSVNDGTKLGFDPAQGGLFRIDGEQLPDDPNPTITRISRPPIVEDSTAIATDMADSNNASVLPSPGDDLSPPNAVQANRLNGIALPISASAGWSTSPPQTTGVYPSAMDYQIRLLCSNNITGDGETLQVTAVWEYTNPRYSDGESMMVKVAIAKTMVQEEKGTTLDLVATRFAEFLPTENRWVNITADVDYTSTAQAVVDAVLQDANANQIAGMATVKAETVELTLGPFSAKARIEVTFQAQGLYSYDAMSVKQDASDIGSQRVLPLFINLPFCPVDHEGGLSKIAVALETPENASILPLEQNRLAYQHLKQQDLLKSTTLLAVSDRSPNHTNCTNGFRYHFDSLPPRSCGILAWLVLPTVEDDNGFDFVHVAQSLETIAAGDPNEQGQVVIQSLSMRIYPI